MAKFRKEPGWLGRAQERREAADRARASAEAGPTSSLPVPAGDAERISAAELEADEA